MVAVPGAGAVGRIGLRADPGLRAPAGAFSGGLDSALGAIMTALAGVNEVVLDKAEEEKFKRKLGGKEDPETEEPDSEAPDPEAPESPPEARDETAPFHWDGIGPETESFPALAAVSARRARSRAGRAEIAAAARDVLSSGETPALELTGRIKAATGKALQARLAEARAAGLDDADLARLEAELGGQELLLLESGLAAQAEGLRAEGQALFAAEAEGLIAGLRADPTQAPRAAAALAGLVGDFASGLPARLLEPQAAQARRDLATAEVEGHLARGDIETAAEVLNAATEIPPWQRRGLAAEIAERRRARPEEERALAEGLAAGLIAEAAAGRSLDLERLPPLLALGARDLLENLPGELERAAERHRVASLLAARPRTDWPEILRAEGLEAEARGPSPETGDPHLRV